MVKSLRWRIAIAAVVVGLGVLYALPSLLHPGSFLQKVLPDKEVNLGLDLRGGINLTLGIDMQSAVETSLSQMGEELRSRSRDEEIFILRPKVTGGNRLQFLLLKEKRTGDLKKLLERHYSEQLRIVQTKSLGEDKKRYLLAMTESYEKKLEEMTIDQALKVIRNRINQFGVSEPDIRRLQNQRIQVQLPGLENAERAIDIIKQTAHLEFRVVDEEADVRRAVQNGKAPPGSELAYLHRKRKQGEGYSKEPIVLKNEVLMTGQHITDAHVAFDSYNQPYVGLNFDSKGARIFERVTEKYTGKRMAIVLDEKVYSAPVIREKISGGRASITGQFSAKEAHDLAIVLRAGSLPAPVKILQERSVGPSLGQQSIDQGVQSMIVGGLLVLLFTIVYYGWGGIIVDLLLCFNLILVMGALAGFGATLTLPGIAGIILIIGMAVDASVLVFERIREELRRGMSPMRAVDEGFARATLTIVDANVTTIMAAVILYQFGTGPIRGFAVTLSIGILASMFTSIFVSRIFFELWLKMKKPASSLKL
jgi:preprotein translocase subunit SecD